MRIDLFYANHMIIKDIQILLTLEIHINMPSPLQLLLSKHIEGPLPLPNP